MRMKMSTRTKLRLLYILSWILFVGISIEAGGFIVGAVVTLVNPTFVEHLWIWQAVDLSALYAYSQGDFFVLTVLMSIVAVMKAVLFYLIIAIIHNKKLNLAQPFNKEFGRFLFNLSYLSLLIGLFSWIGVEYVLRLVHQGVKMPDVHYLQLGGADVWLFMGIILIIIAQIFKRGIEIQSENDLTI